MHGSELIKYCKKVYFFQTELSDVVFINDHTLHVWKGWFIVNLFGNAPICASTVLECSFCRIHRYVLLQNRNVYTIVPSPTSTSTLILACLLHINSEGSLDPAPIQPQIQTKRQAQHSTTTSVVVLILYLCSLVRRHQNHGQTGEMVAY
jgi:hypothetical protein